MAFGLYPFSRNVDIRISTTAPLMERGSSPADTRLSGAEAGTPSPRPWPEYTLAVMALILFYVGLNMSSILSQARGLGLQMAGATIFRYFASLLVWIALFQLARKRTAWTARTPAGRWLRGAFLGVLLMPAVFCWTDLVYPNLENAPLVGNLGPLLMSMQVPVALMFFFRMVPPPFQALYYGLAVGAGYVCWAMVVLLAEPSPQEVVVRFSGLEMRHLVFIQIVRCLAAAGFALICWRLAGLQAGRSHDADEASAPQPVHCSKSHRSSRPAHCPDDGTAACPDCGTEPWQGGLQRARFTAGCAPHFPARFPTHFPKSHFAMALAPFMACFVLNGMTGYLFFPRLISRGLHLEYMYLALLILLPLAGWYISRKGDKALFRLAVSGVSGAAVVSLILFLDAPPHDFLSPLLLFIYPACAAIQQILLLCGALIAARFAPFSRLPVLTVCTAWLGLFLPVPGNLLAFKALPALDLSPQSAVLAMSLVCLASLALLRRAFPLPPCHPAPEFQSDSSVSPVPESCFTPSSPTSPYEPSSPQGPGQAGLRPELEPLAAPKFSAFCQAYRLSARESQVLSAIVGGAKAEAIAAEIGITERTVRFHQTGLFRKTGQRNSRILALYYAAWTPRTGD